MTSDDVRASLKPGSPDPEPGSITLFVSRIREGDEVATQALWNRCFPRLLQIAQRTLRDHPQRATDAEDAVQSAFIGFWQQLQRGDFDESLNRDSLWKLLATITRRRAQMHARRERAEKRGGGRIRTESELTAKDGSQPTFDRMCGELPTQEFDLACQELLSRLNDEQRSIAVHKLGGYTNDEIAERLGCTTRRIERKLQLIRREWAEHMT